MSNQELLVKKALRIILELCPWNKTFKESLQFCTTGLQLDKWELLKNTPQLFHLILRNITNFQKEDDKFMEFT